MAKLFDRVGQATATTGTGTLTLGSVITDATNGDLATFADMGGAAGDSVNYLIVDGNNWEIGTGTLGGTGPGFTLSRTVKKAKISGTVGTTALTLSGSAKVYSVALAAVDNSFSGAVSSLLAGTGYNPAFQFQPGTGAGIGTAGGYITIVNGAADVFNVGGDHIALSAGYPPDVRLNRGAANVLALSNSTNAQKFQVYGSTDATSGAPTNYSRLSISHAGGTSGATIATEAGGTGTAGPLTLNASTYSIKVAGTVKLDYDTTVSGKWNFADDVCVSNGAGFQIGTNANRSFIISTFGGGRVLNASSDFGVGWGSGTVVSGNNDTGLGRNAAGIVEVNNGTAGTLAQLYAKTVRTQALTVATLPSASTAGAGARAFVTDATAPTFGATVAGSGAVATPVYSDGTNWKVG